MPAGGARAVERVQTGVRIEKRLLLVLKGLAAALDMSLGDLIEGMALHAFEGKAPFGPETRARIAGLRAVYGLDLTSADSHRLVDAAAPAPRRPRTARRRAPGRSGRPRT